MGGLVRYDQASGGPHFLSLEVCNCQQLVQGQAEKVVKSQLPAPNRDRDLGLERPGPEVNGCENWRDKASG